MPEHYSEVKYFSTENSARKSIEEIKVSKSRDQAATIILYAKHKEGWTAIFGWSYSTFSKKFSELKNIDNKAYNEIAVEKKIPVLKKTGMAVLSFVIVMTQVIFMIIIGRYFGIINAMSIYSESNFLGVVYLLFIISIYYETLRSYLQSKRKISRTLLIILAVWVVSSL